MVAVGAESANLKKNKYTNAYDSYTTIYIT
jgi:hypothetical protein